MGQVIVMMAVDDLKPYANNARTHSEKQIANIAYSIKEFGFNDPIAIDEKRVIIEGHGRLEAAKLLGLEYVPTIELSHMTKAQKKAYILAHNKIAMDAGYDMSLLKIELEDIVTEGIDPVLTGFDGDEVDKIINTNIDGIKTDNEEEMDHLVIPPNTTWILGMHRVKCGGADGLAAIQSMIKHWQEITKNDAIMEETGQTLKDLAYGRR